MAIEIYKSVKDCPHYQISNFGNVRSFTKKSNGKLLTPTLSKCGYYMVSLYNNGIRNRKKIHRLVAEHFVSGQSRQLEVDHIDGNPLNNKHTNLQWISHKENVQKGRCGETAAKTHSKTYLLEFPNGTSKLITNLTKYAREQGITPDHLNRVARGVRKHYKGIKVTLVGAVV